MRSMLKADDVAKTLTLKHPGSRADSFSPEKGQKTEDAFGEFDEEL